MVCAVLKSRVTCVGIQMQGHFNVYGMFDDSFGLIPLFMAERGRRMYKSY